MYKRQTGPKGGPSGDLLIQIKEKPHDHLRREGANLIYEMYLNFADASLGSSIEVPTLDGKANIKIPAGTQAGKVFRLKDKGLSLIHIYVRSSTLTNRYGLTGLTNRKGSKTHTNRNGLA